MTFRSGLTYNPNVKPHSLSCSVAAQSEHSLEVLMDIRIHTAAKVSYVSPATSVDFSLLSQLMHQALSAFFTSH